MTDVLMLYCLYSLNYDNNSNSNTEDEYYY